MAITKQAGRGRIHRSLWKRALVFYAALLCASYVYWGLNPRTAEPLAGQHSMTVAEVAGGATTGRDIRIAFRDEVPDSGRERPVLVLLHGSPGGFLDFRNIVSALRDDYRLVIPDLPGFGASRADIADYSIAAHGTYVAALLDGLGIAGAHIVGFSMGGGVALELYAQAPEHVRSITLLSAIGVQELELFGSYELNHAVHALQTGVIETLHRAFPHFGALETFPLNRHYARNFFDTDQRPLRAILEGYTRPLLILHGEQDPLVPVHVAREHHRIVPHSELQLYDASHFMLWKAETYPRLARRIADFVERTEAGTSASRDAATAARVQAAAQPFDAGAVPAFAGLALIFMMLLLALATLVSEDLTCIAAGLLVADGRIGLLAASLACFLGILVGDVLLYAFGRFVGRPAVERAPLSWVVTPAGIDRAAAWFKKRGASVIFLSRFTPGLRLPTYFASGVLRTRFSFFLFYFVIAGVLWTPTLVALASWAGAEIKPLLTHYEAYALPAVLLLVLILLCLQRLIVPLFSTRGRRLLLGSYLRKRHWEFWPAFVFYMPLVAYVGWLVVRYRGFRVVTAVNPAIPGGGFVGESKADILEAFDAAPEIASFVRLAAQADPESRLHEARAFAREHGLPVVLKPDVGQRGSGVRIVRDDTDLAARLAELKVDSLLQAFVPGEEYGIFYIRQPEREQGQIFSITAKHFPILTGDGKHTLEELILRDPRAVALANTYMDMHAARLQDVLTAGEELQLAELGTHCRGAVFTNGAGLETPALVEHIDALSKRYDGFYFGRYDVRTPSAEALQRGEFKVIELNGLTSEATHIYERGTPLRAAYRVLFEQWRQAFAIGKTNARRGAATVGLFTLLRTFLAYRISQRGHK